jgi:uncharacterized protein YjbI with pentapeptide repeats
MDDSQDRPELEKALPASPDHTRPEPLRSQLPDRESVPSKAAVPQPAAKLEDAVAIRAGVEPSDSVHARHDVLPSAVAPVRVDHRGADLRKADLENSHLAGVDFTGADLTAVNLAGSDLTGANFSGANLSNLPGTIEGEQHFDPPWGKLARLSRANLTGANFSCANLRGVDLTEANLGGANLRGANLTGAQLHGANLKGANLTGANLTRAKLPGANLIGANLNDSTLNDADLRFADLQSAQLRGARLKRADLSYGNFEKADLGGVDLTGSYLARANLRDAYLSGARLRNCRLFAANLGNADLRRADVRNAMFDRAWLVGADLEFADLRGATFSKSWLLGTNLQGTKTSGAALQDARCSPTTAFPMRLNYLRRARTLFSVNKAGAWSRFRGTEYGVRENATAYRPVVVLRCVGEATSGASYNGLQLLPFTQLISEWTELLNQLDVFRNDIPARILLIDGFEAWETAHCAAIAIGVSAPTMPILAAILKASSPIPRTRDELLDRAEKARASVTLMLQRLDRFIANDASRLSEGTPSSFFAGCIDAIWKLRLRGGDVVLIDSVGDEGPDAAAKIIRELRESI